VTTPSEGLRIETVLRNEIYTVMRDNRVYNKRKEEDKNIASGQITLNAVVKYLLTGPNIVFEVSRLSLKALCHLITLA